MSTNQANLVLNLVTLILVIFGVTIAVLVLRALRKDITDRLAGWESLIMAIEASSRSTRHSIKNLTAALRMEERAKELQALRDPLEYVEEVDDEIAER